MGFLSLPIKHLGSVLIAAIIPFVIITCGYLLLYGLITGKFETGISERIYMAFEQGHDFAYEYPMTDVRKVYGTPEENRYSIISAIKRNPEAFIDRIKHSSSTARSKLYNIYGERLGLLFFLLAALGIIEMVRKGLYLLLLIFLLWPLHIFVYFFTFIRPQYFLLPYFVIFSLTAVGLNSIIFNLGEKRLCTYTLVAVGVIFFAIQTNRPNLFLVVLFTLIGLWIIQIIMKQYGDLKTINQLGLALALCFILFLKGNYPHPQFRVLGVSPYEKGSLFMKEHVEAGSIVLASVARDVLNAKMTVGSLDIDVNEINDASFYRKLVCSSIKAIYTYAPNAKDDPILWPVMEKLIKKGFLEVGFRSENGEVAVLLVNKKFLER